MELKESPLLTQGSSFILSILKGSRALQAPSHKQAVAVTMTGFINAWEAISAVEEVRALRERKSDTQPVSDSQTL